MTTETSDASSGDASSVTPTAPTEAPAADAPEGTLTGTAPCCPDVATFEGSTAGRHTYFGFDDKTNSVETEGSDEYWVPPTKDKSLPDRETRDGARWVSVGVDLETQVEINFAGEYTASCLPNVTFEVEPARIADVVTTRVASSGAAFKIRGKRRGEASLKVMCDGKLRGYFHIWCAPPVVIPLDIAWLKSSRTVDDMYDLSAITDELQTVFSQALISFDIQDLGVLDLDSMSDFKEFEDSFYENDFFRPLMDNLTMLDLYASYTPSDQNPGAPIPRHDSVKLYYYVPDKVAEETDGSVIIVGRSPAFCFTNAPILSENTAAHEVGHVLGLEHPTSILGDYQFAEHIQLSTEQPLEPLRGTNTEPRMNRFYVGARVPNVMAKDPYNLMGYWPPEDRKYLRYHQWKALRFKN